MTATTPGKAQPCGRRTGSSATLVGVFGRRQGRGLRPHAGEHATLRGDAVPLGHRTVDQRYLGAQFLHLGNGVSRPIADGGLGWQRGRELRGPDDSSRPRHRSSSPRRSCCFSATGGIAGRPASLVRPCRPDRRRITDGAMRRPARDNPRGCPYHRHGPEWSTSLIPARRSPVRRRSSTSARTSRRFSTWPAPPSRTPSLAPTNCSTISWWGTARPPGGLALQRRGAAGRHRPGARQPAAHHPRRRTDRGAGRRARRHLMDLLPKMAVEQSATVVVVTRDEKI